MKVCVVTPSFFPAKVYGGPIFSTLYTYRELASLGVNINVSTTNANGNTKLYEPVKIFSKFSDNLYVKYYNETLIGRFSLSLMLHLWKDIKPSELVHIQAVFSSPTPIALFYASIYKKPIILSPRGSLGEWCLVNKRSSFKKFWLNFLILPFKKKIIWHATSEQEKNEILSIDSNAKVVIIPNGFEPGIVFIPVNASRSIKSKVIISMGRIHKKKGFDILITCFKNILDHYPDSILKIAGKDDGEKENLILLAKNLKIEDKVLFIDHLEGNEKNRFLSDADVFVLPSHNENFGNVYVEALAAGTPIVASTNTPWEEVEEAGCGRWVPNTVEETSGAMLDILSQDRETMRQNALKYVQKFDWKNIALDFKKLYESLV